MGKQPEHECGACWSTSDYSRADLEADGWVWHIIQKRTNMRNESRVFVMCDACQDLYADRRKAKAAKA